MWSWETGDASWQVTPGAGLNVLNQAIQPRPAVRAGRLTGKADLIMPGSVSTSLAGDIAARCPYHCPVFIRVNPSKSE